MNRFIYTWTLRTKTQTKKGCWWQTRFKSKQGTTANTELTRGLSHTPQFREKIARVCPDPALTEAILEPYCHQ